MGVSLGSLPGYRAPGSENTGSYSAGSQAIALAWVLRERMARTPLLERARAYQPYWKLTTGCVGKPVAKTLLGPNDTRLPLLTEAIPVGVTTLRMNAAKLAEPVTCTP